MGAGGIVRVRANEPPARGALAAGDDALLFPRNRISLYYRERKNKPACVPTSARDDTSRRARTLPSRYMPSLLVPIPSPARASRAASLGSVETRRVSRRVARIASASSSSSDEISSRRRDRRNPAATRLRELLAGPDIVQTPCAHDALSASLIERAGFKAGFMSGFCVSAARLAMPDAGLIS